MEIIINNMNQKELILKIVDSCFHEFASSYRIDAKEKASVMYDDHASQMPSDEIELVSLRKQLDEATKYIKALEEREF